MHIEESKSGKCVIIFESHLTFNDLIAHIFQFAENWLFYIILYLYALTENHTIELI